MRDEDFFLFRFFLFLDFLFWFRLCCCFFIQIFSFYYSFRFFFLMQIFNFLRSFRFFVPSQCAGFFLLFLFMISFFVPPSKYFPPFLKRFILFLVFLGTYFYVNFLTPVIFFHPIILLCSFWNLIFFPHLPITFLLFFYFPRSNHFSSCFFLPSSLPTFSWRIGCTFSLFSSYFSLFLVRVLMKRKYNKENVC